MKKLITAILFCFSAVFVSAQGIYDPNIGLDIFTAWVSNTKLPLSESGKLRIRKEIYTVSTDSLKRLMSSIVKFDKQGCMTDSICGGNIGIDAENLISDRHFEYENGHISRCTTIFYPNSEGAKYLKFHFKTLNDFTTISLIYTYHYKNDSIIIAANIPTVGIKTSVITNNTFYLPYLQLLQQEILWDKEGKWLNQSYFFNHYKTTVLQDSLYNTYKLFDKKDEQKCIFEIELYKDSTLRSTKDFVRFQNTDFYYSMGHLAKVAHTNPDTQYEKREAGAEIKYIYEIPLAKKPWLKQIHRGAERTETYDKAGNRIALNINNTSFDQKTLSYITQTDTYLYEYDKAKKLIKISVNLHNTAVFQKYFEYEFYK
jgi:hypothetical protein